MGTDRKIKRKNQEKRTNNRAREAVLEDIVSEEIEWDASFALLDETEKRTNIHIGIVRDVLTATENGNKVEQELNVKLSGIKNVLETFAIDLKDIRSTINTAKTYFIHSENSDKFECVMDFQEASVKLASIAQELLKVILDFNMISMESIGIEPDAGLNEMKDFAKELEEGK